MSEMVEPGVNLAVEGDAVGSTAAPAPEALSCGAHLRAARELKRMSLVDVAQRLKYSARQVQALEEGNYEALPGLTFQRGFVRGYAKLLGLEASSLVAHLEREVGRDNGPTTAQLQQIAYAPAVMPSPVEGTSAWPWILGMLLAVVGIGGYTLYKWDVPMRSGDAPARPAQPAAAAVEPSIAQPNLEPVGREDASERPIPMPQPSVDVIASGAGSDAAKAGEAFVGVPGSSAGIFVPGSVTSGKIHLTFSGESWVEVRQGNGTLVYSGINGAGSEQWVDGQPPFDLVVGNARVVKLMYRGAEVILEPYTKVTVARLQLK